MLSFTKRINSLKKMNQFAKLQAGPGRPSFKIEIDFNNPQSSIDQIRLICNHRHIKDKVHKVAKALLESSTEVKDAGSQANFDISDIMSEISENGSSEEISYLISTLWTETEISDKVKLMMIFYDQLSLDGQEDFFAYLGNCLNDDMYKASTTTGRNLSDMNLEDLKEAKKCEFYHKCDKRLKSFLDHLTKKQYHDENVNFKSNVYENILKARNSKYVSKVGLKEHMVTYLASGKSRHATQVFSKQGGKGTRPVLEKILKNSEGVCKFSTPEKRFLLFSFDNIQKLLKSYRIGGNHQKKILAIVVCSILCLLFGDENCELQFKYENCPATWYSEYSYVKEKNIFVQQLDANTLKECIKVNEEDTKVINDYFESELKDALDAVSKDMDENLQDSVDIMAKSEIAKKRKLCHSGHINDNVRTNRTNCDREYCKAKLKDDGNAAIVTQVNNDAKAVDNVKDAIKAKRYLNVPYKTIDETPEEKAVGALVINPNKSERIARVLDEISEAAGMKNKYCVKIVLSGETVTKVFNDNEDFRKFVVVTADGLPYKAMIDLIKNEHICAVCGKKFKYIAEITDHMKESKHNEFYQTYGNILPNIGHFHYSLTMLRSLVKLEWNIDYQELVKSIHFETPKALFMQEKVTDFRKSLDTYKTARAAKLREFVTPYVKYAKENKLDINVASYLLWKKFFVKSESYEVLFQIEKFFGTSFLLFHSAVRANNFQLVKSAKKIFSSLFHINRHPNYAIMDIHTEYLDEKLRKNVPELSDYLEVRKVSNFTGKPYANEPHDERHEEFNKRGMNMQNIQTAEDFKQSFQLVDHYTKMKDTLFDDYDIKMHGGNVTTVIDYEENILKMRVSMRKQNYLNKPEREGGMFSLEKKELNPELINIFKIALNQRQEDIMNVIRHNDFTAGYSTGAKIKILKDDSEDKLGIDYETQLEILIAREESSEIRENLIE